MLENSLNNIYVDVTNASPIFVYGIYQQFTIAQINDTSI